MRKFLPLMLGALMAFPALARDFNYAYKGQTLTYTVIDEEAKTCKTTDGQSESSMTPGNSVDGSLVIPEIAKDGNVEYTVTEIGELAFYNCSEITDVTIPNTVETIGLRAFGNCGSLTEVVIPNTVKTIGDYAFFSCRALAEVTIGNSVETIGKGAFSQIRALANATIPNSVKTIGDMAFYNSSLPEVIIGDSVETIGKQAFANTYLTDVTIPNSVKIIDDKAFFRCSYLSNVVIGNSVEVIGDNAFESCNSLTELIIPNSVKKTGGLVCSSGSLVKAAYPNTLSNPFPFSISVAYPAEGAIIEDGIIYGPDKSAIYFVTVKHEGGFDIPNSVESICEYAFYGCDKLTAINFGSSVKSIGAYSFVGCSFSDLVIPPSVETIGSQAFDGNDINSLAIGCGIKEIGESAFNCKNQIKNIYVTAVNPPAAFDNTFNNYEAPLWLIDQKAFDKYVNSPSCWNLFKNNMHAMKQIEEVTVDKLNITGAPGDEIKLNATIVPADATLPNIFWKSTRPDIVTVDDEGNVTFVGGENSEPASRADAGDCKIIAMTMFDNVPVVEINVNIESSGIEDVETDSTENAAIDFNAPYEVYNLSGCRIGASTEGLASGIYIIRQGKNVMKIAVK